VRAEEAAQEVEREGGLRELRHASDRHGRVKARSGTAWSEGENVGWLFVGLNRGWREEGGNSRKLPMEWKAKSIGERIHGSFRVQ
jgi:hypothetical protein